MRSRDGMLDSLAQNLVSHAPRQDMSHSSEPFAERSRSELTTGVGSLGFDSARPTEPYALRFQP